MAGSILPATCSAQVRTPPMLPARILPANATMVQASVIRLMSRDDRRMHSMLVARKGKAKLRQLRRQRHHFFYKSDALLGAA